MAFIDFTTLQSTVQKEQEEATKRKAEQEKLDNQVKQQAPEKAEDKVEAKEPQNDPKPPRREPKVPDTVNDTEGEEKEPESTPSGRRVPDVEVPKESNDTTIEPTLDGTEDSTPKASSQSTDVRQVKRKADVKPRPENPKARVGDVAAIKMASVRSLPAELVNEAKRLFPEATNNVDAVTVYMAYKSGISSALNKDQREMLKHVSDADPIVTLNERIEHIERGMTSMVALMQELELLSTFMVYDRLGFRVETPESPKDVNLNENGMKDMLARIREVARTVRLQEKYSAGRPIR